MHCITFEFLLVWLNFDIFTHSLVFHVCLFSKLARSVQEKINTKGLSKSYKLILNTHFLQLALIKSLTSYRVLNRQLTELTLTSLLRVKHTTPCCH